MSVSLGDAPKSILKLPSTSATTPKPSPAEARRIALTHATTLQIRKVLETSVLTSLTYLLDLPLNAPSTPTVPVHQHRRDIRAFKHHLRFFSPADYDSLIEERNILSRCGYALCPCPRRKMPSRSRLALVDKGKKDMRWVERTSLERFCGEECARCALWVRVQLGTEPAWTRAEVVGAAEVAEATGEVTGIDLDSEEPEEGWDDSRCGISLLEEAEERKAGGVWGSGDEKDVAKLAEELQGIGIEDAGRLLKIERDGDVRSAGREDLLGDIAERPVGLTVVVTLPKDDEGEGEDGWDGRERNPTMAIEGYVPKMGLRKKVGK
jgi:hypothetical protein